MRYLILFSVVVFALLGWVFVSAYPGEFGSPAVPQQIYGNPALAHYDVQVHNRNDWQHWDGPMDAQHTSACGAPPGTHSVYNLSDGVFVCNDHVMTAANSGGYGEVVLVPSQTLDCTASCTVTFDVSTERQSYRDWWELRLTPYLENQALPFNSDLGADLQGAPRNFIDVSIENGQSIPRMTVANNDVITDFGQFWWSTCTANGTDGCTPAFNESITAGTNQAAVRQTFKLTVTTGHLKFERLASATAPGIVFQDKPAPVVMRNDYVVGFEHHSYNPTKSGAGVPATWHWSNLTNMSPSSPFTLIHMLPQCTGCANLWLVQASNTLVQFASPAPSNSYLRFSGICRVLINGTQVERQQFLGYADHASSYFVPITQGTQSVMVSFAPDVGAPGVPCAAQDFHIWSRNGTIPPSPTPISPSPTNVPVFTPTPVNVTVTPVPPTPTSTTTIPTPTVIVPTPTATNTPNPGPLRQCTLRWGNNTIESYGNLTQAECAARGN